MAIYSLLAAWTLGDQGVSAWSGTRSLASTVAIGRSHPQASMLASTDLLVRRLDVHEKTAWMTTIAPNDPAASVARCAKEARMFMLSPWARWTSTALLRLTTSPRVAMAARPGRRRRPARGHGTASCPQTGSSRLPPRAAVR